MRLALATFLVLHGVAHVVGAADAFGAANDGSTVDYLFGGWPIADPALLRLVGVAWAVAALGHAIAAWGIAARARWRIAALGGATIFSLAVSTAALGTSWVGVVIDVVLLGAIVWSRRRARSGGQA